MELRDDRAEDGGAGPRPLRARETTAPGRGVRPPRSSERQRALAPALVALFLVFAGPAQAEEADVLEGRFLDLEIVESDGEIVFAAVKLESGLTFQVSQAYKDQIRSQVHALGIDRNSRVHVTLEDGKVTLLQPWRPGVATTDLTRFLSPEVRKALEEVKVGDDIQVNERHSGRLVKKTQGHIEIRPRMPNGALLDGSQSYWLKDIRSLVKVSDAGVGASPDGPVTVPKDADIVTRKGLLAGDTIGVGLCDGSIQTIDDKELTLLVWDGREYAEPRMFARAFLDESGTLRCDNVWLQRRQVLPAAAEGEIVLEVNRQRIGRERSLRFRAIVRNQAKSRVLVGATLEFRAFDRVGGEGSPILTERVALEPIFEGESREEAFAFTSDAALDGTGVLVYDPEKSLLESTSPEAGRHLLQALAARPVDDPRRTSIVYRAIASSAHPDLTRAVIWRALETHLTAGTREAPSREVPTRSAEIAMEELLRFGPTVGRVVLADVGDGTNPPLRMVITPDGKLERRPQADPPKRMEHFLELLGRLPEALDTQCCVALFDLQHAKPMYAEAVRAVFAKHEAVTVEGLIDLAVTTAAIRKSEEERNRAADAMKVLQSLGAAAVDPIIDQVVRAGLDPSGLEKARTQLRAGDKSVSASEIVRSGLALIIEKRLRKWRAEITQLVGEARAHNDEGRFEEALQKAKRVMEMAPGHEEAMDVIAGVHEGMADACLKAEPVRRGEAVRHLRESVQLYTASTDKAAKKKLPATAMKIAQIMLQGAREDLDGNCVRAGPSEVFEVVEVVPEGTPLTVDATLRPPDGWTPVRVKKGLTGWIANSCVSGGPDSVTVAGRRRPSENLRSLVDAAREIAPVQSEADRFLGEILAVEAVEAFELGNFQIALKKFEEAEKYLPAGDPRLEKKSEAWRRSKMLAFGTLGVIVLAALACSALLLIRRQKRVKAPREYVFYGKDRMKHERELEADEADAGA